MGRLQAGGDGNVNHQVGCEWRGVLKETTRNGGTFQGQVEPQYTGISQGSTEMAPAKTASNSRCVA